MSRAREQGGAYRSFRQVAAFLKPAQSGGNLLRVGNAGHFDFVIVRGGTRKTNRSCAHEALKEALLRHGSRECQCVQLSCGLGQKALAANGLVALSQSNWLPSTEATTSAELQARFPAESIATPTETPTGALRNIAGRPVQTTRSSVAMIVYLQTLKIGSRRSRSTTTGGLGFTMEGVPRVIGCSVWQACRPPNIRVVGRHAVLAGPLSLWSGSGVDGARLPSSVSRLLGC